MNQQRIRFRQLDFKLDEFQDKLGEWSIAKKGMWTNLSCHCAC